MARDFMNTVLLAGASYLGYRVALTGGGGAAAQRTAFDILKSIKGQSTACKEIAGYILPDNVGKICTGTISGAPSSNPAGVTQSGTSGVQTSEPSGLSSQLDQMWIANHHIISQGVQWRQERAQRSEDPNDWAAFELHETQLGAPDPGSTPPPEWPNGPVFGGPLDTPVTGGSNPYLNGPYQSGNNSYFSNPNNA